MAQEKKSEEEKEEEVFFEDIIKKTKTGITFPKELRERYSMKRKKHSSE